MTQLHQILAVESGVRNQSQKDLTAAHHGLQQAAMLEGLDRTYQPIKEDGEQFPPEKKLLQVRVPDVIKETHRILEKMFDITAIRDFANTKAKADVVVDGQTLLKDAPSPYLLWLESKLEDLHTFVTKLPTLPTDTAWDWDPTQNCHRNRDLIKTVKTAKIEYSLVLLEPTKEHPGQAVPKVRDENVGWWTSIKYHGGLAVPVVKAMKERVEKLQKAVKMAREKANEVEVNDDLKVGGVLLKYVFGDMV
jgi:hypothetical protein